MEFFKSLNLVFENFSLIINICNENIVIDEKKGNW